MTAKQYLRQGYRLNELIQSHRDEAERLRELADAIAGANIDGVRGGTRWNGESAQINNVIKAVDLERQIQQEIRNMETLMFSIHNSIEAVRNADERLVLRCRYILFLTWEDTAERMHYSTTQVKRLHGTALRSVIVPEKS